MTRTLSSVTVQPVSAAVGAEILATRRELESLVRGDREVRPLRGWRRSVVGEALLAAL